MNGYLRKESLQIGLEPPEEHKLFCGCAECKADSPSLTELSLSSSQHPYKPMRDLQKSFFNALIDLVTKYEEEALDIFELPGIERVREAVITGNTDHAGIFTLSRSQRKQYKNMLSEWQYDLIADKALNKQDAQEDEQSAVYNWHLLLAFTIGLKRVKSQALRNIPEDLRALVENIDIAPDINNTYLQAIKKDGLKRIKTKLSQKQRDFVLEQLQQMAKEGRNPLYVARKMHKQFEGNAWYWNRLARSESALALNASYDSWSRAANVKYDVWSTGGSNPCPICLALEGQMWLNGEGPRPVDATHPHCMCERTAQWISQGRIPNPPWRRPSPYDNPYQIIRDENGLLTVPELQGLLR